MQKKIAATARMLEISEEELFVRAYRLHGLMFATRPPRDAYDRWRKGLCIEPLYVVKFINRLIATVH